MRRSPLRVHYLLTRRPHLGPHAGLPAFVKHLAPDRVSPSLREVSNGDEDFIARFPFVSAGLRTRFRHRLQRRRQYWYKLSDFVAELDTAPGFLAREFDLLHAIDGEHTAQYLPLARRRFRVGVPVVATYHQPPSLLEPILSRDVVQSLDHVTVLAATQQALLASMMPAERVSVILHGVDTAFFTPGAAAPSARMRCLTTGSWQRDWMVLTAITAALPAVEFHIVSGGASGFENRPNVTVHRGISDEYLRELYRASHLAVLPLLEAAANNALLEAMACGTPVVASDLPSLREYAPAPTVAFVEHRVEAFVVEIQTLLADGARRQAMSEAGLARAHQLSWPRVAARYAAQYERILANALVGPAWEAG